MSTPTLEEARAALAHVIDPVFDKPMLEIGTLSNLRLDGDTLKAKASVSSPAKAVEERVRAAVEKAVPGIELTVETVVPTREVTGEDPIPNVRNVILVMSGKGGVGKSTTSVNLTLALQDMGSRVGLLDADIYGPSIPTMMGVNGHPVSEDGKKIQPLERFGVKMMSIGFLLESDTQAVVWRGPMLHGALKQFLEDVSWGHLDYLVIDLPPGTGDVALTMAQRLKVSGVVMVTTPQAVALADVYKSVSMCRKLNLPLLGVIENMSHFIDSAGVKHELFGAGGGKKVAEFSDAPLLAQIPIESEVRRWGDEGMPIVRADPNSDVSKGFAKAADALTEAIAKRHFVAAGGEKAPKGKGPKRLKIVR